MPKKGLDEPGAARRLPHSQKMGKQQKQEKREKNGRKNLRTGTDARGNKDHCREEASST